MPSKTSIYTPHPEVQIDGAAAALLTEQLLSMTVEDAVEGMSSCELVIRNWGVRAGRLDYLFLSRDLVDFGGRIEVKIGPPDERATVFVGRVTGIEARYPREGSPVVLVLAEDAFQDLRMTRRTRTFRDVSDADVVQAVARDHGLQTEVDVDGPTHRVVNQLNQSDLAFVRARVRPLGADVWIDGSTLHAKRPDADGGDAIVLRRGHELRTFSALADLAHQCTEQRVTGWDVQSKSAISESATSGDLATEVGAGLSGVALLEDTFGRRVQSAPLTVPASSAEARALARGLLADRARRFVTGTGIADGIAALRSGRPVELSGLGPMFTGTYRVVRSRHRYDAADGFRTEFEVERPAVTA